MLRLRGGNCVRELDPGILRKRFSADPEDVWSSTEDEDELNDILDMVDSEAVTYEFVAQE